jgi:hypothetical protein
MSVPVDDLRAVGYTVEFAHEGSDDLPDVYGVILPGDPPGLTYLRDTAEDVAAFLDDPARAAE